MSINHRLFHEEEYKGRARNYNFLIMNALTMNVAFEVLLFATFMCCFWTVDYFIVGFERCFRKEKSLYNSFFKELHRLSIN